jgi:hypothetical protein
MAFVKREIYLFRLPTGQSTLLKKVHLALHNSHFTTHT